MADEAEALEADRTQGRPEDPVSQKAAILDAMEKENIPVPNNANKLTVGELEQKLEAGRFRKERMMEDANIPVPNNANKLTVGELQQKFDEAMFRRERRIEDQLVIEPELVDDDMYSGGYVKQYAAGGSVRKANFMDN